MSVNTTVKKQSIDKCNRLIVIIELQKSEYNNMQFIMDSLSVNSLVISINLDTPGSEKDENSSLMERITNIVKAEAEIQEIPASNIIIIGSRVAGTMAQIIATLNNYNYLAIGPLINRTRNQRDVEMLLAQGFPLNRLGAIIENGDYRGAGKVVFSHYDCYESGYEENLYSIFVDLKNIQVVVLEDFMWGVDIRRAGYDLTSLIREGIENLIKVFMVTGEYQYYQLRPTNYTSETTTKFELEKYHHKVIGGKKRCIKYQEKRCYESKVLIVVFSDEVELNNVDAPTHDTTSGYDLSALKNGVVNSIFIRSSFAKTGGIHTYDLGLDYTQELILGFIEEKREKLKIDKQNVILAGVGFGGLAAIRYAHLGEYNHILAIQPRFDIERQLEGNSEEFLGIDRRQSGLQSYIKELVSTDFKLNIFNEEIKGIVLYSNYMEMNAKAQVENVLPNVEIIDLNKEAIEIGNDDSEIRKVINCKATKEIVGSYIKNMKKE